MANTFIDRIKKITQYSYVLIVILLISLIFPQGSRFTYEYSVGQSWQYTDLNAPFEFAILKDPILIKKQRKEIIKNFPPYYEKIENRKQVEVFENLLWDEIEAGRIQFVQEKDTSHTLEIVSNILEKEYEKGVVLDNLSHNHSPHLLHVKDGNRIDKKLMNSLSDAKKYTKTVSDIITKKTPLKLTPTFQLNLEKTVRPNIVYNDSVTQFFLKNELGQLAETQGVIKKGTLIIKKNAIVSVEIFNQLESLKSSFANGETIQSRWANFLGYFLLTSLIIGLYLIFIQAIHPKVLDKPRNVFFLLSWMVLFSFLIVLVERIEGLSVYLIPFSIVVIVVKNFFNERLAFITYVTLILLSSIVSSEGYEFTILQLIVGMVAILSSVDTRNWNQFFMNIIYIFIGYVIGYLGLLLIQTGVVSLHDGKMVGWFVLNCLLLLIAFPLVPIMERLFGFVSSVTLVELSDMNKPILRELSLKAPGTFQHSLQVSNLSEAAAIAISADALLVKVAALYHDIGKINQPHYFIENAPKGFNPHSKISALESAKIILGHVTDGVQLAKKHKLPEPIIDIIKTHHGTTTVAYFMNQHKEKFGEVDSNDFTYDGPNPTTKEQAILMIADSIEAASKSLKEFSPQSISNLVDNIIKGKINHHQLDNCEISFAELKICSQIFKDMIMNINHVRVEYPKENKS